MGFREWGEGNSEKRERNLENGKREKERKEGET